MGPIATLAIGSRRGRTAFSREANCRGIAVSMGARALSEGMGLVDGKRCWGVGLALIAGVLLFHASTQAQIYSCTAPDGTRVYSDKKCGPDAQMVKGITSSKRPSAAKAATAPPKSPTELNELLELCNTGDRAACMRWTKSGGPNQLRLKEQQLEQSCAAGSLPACEERYCRDGVSEECRQRVLLVTSLSGETWYLRDQDRPPARDGFATYSVRCMRRDSREFRDVQVRCATTAGPSRCLNVRTQQGFPRLELAASNSCSAQNDR